MESLAFGWLECPFSSTVGMLGNFPWTRKFLAQGNFTSIGLISLSTHVGRIPSSLVSSEEKIFWRNSFDHVLVRWVAFLKGMRETKIRSPLGGPSFHPKMKWLKYLLLLIQTCFSLLEWKGKSCPNAFRGRWKRLRKRLVRRWIQKKIHFFDA